MTAPRPLAALLVVVALTAPASAQVFSPDPILSCLQSGGGIACAGASVAACRAASPGGQSNVGGTACLDAEFRWWDAQMGSVFTQLQAIRAREAEQNRLQGLHDYGAPQALAALQRAFLDWRTAVCDYEVSLWQGGTGGASVGVACQMRLTAQQALVLDGYLREARQ